MVNFSAAVSGNESFPQDAAAVLLAEFGVTGEAAAELLMERIAELSEELARWTSWSWTSRTSRAASPRPTPLCTAA